MARSQGSSSKPHLAATQQYFLPGIKNNRSNWHILRIHDTFVLKTTRKVTFMRFLGCNLINCHDRPYKVYISLKRRAFYIHFKKQNWDLDKCSGFWNGKCGKIKIHSRSLGTQQVQILFCLKDLWSKGGIRGAKNDYHFKVWQITDILDCAMSIVPNHWLIIFMNRPHTCADFD